MNNISSGGRSSVAAISIVAATARESVGACSGADAVPSLSMLVAAIKASSTISRFGGGSCSVGMSAIVAGVDQKTTANTSMITKFPALTPNRKWHFRDEEMGSVIWALLITFASRLSCDVGGTDCPYCQAMK